MPTIELRAVTKRYGRGPRVLDALDLVAAGGEAVRLHGPNGCGKTTLLRIAAGVLRPTSGARRSTFAATGWASADPIGPSTLPARPLLTAFAERHGSPLAATQARAARLGCGELLDEPLGTLSEGTRRKVNLLVALTVAPGGLLVVDEPTTGLDDQALIALGEILAEHTARGGGLVLADHRDDLDAAVGVRLVAIGSPGGPGRTDTVEGAVVIRASRNGESQQVVAEPARSDDTLRALLDDGWTIVSVERR